MKREKRERERREREKREREDSEEELLRKRAKENLRKKEG